MKPNLKKILDEGFEHSGVGNHEWAVYKKGDDRILYSITYDKIITKYTDPSIPTGLESLEDGGGDCL